MFFFLPLLFIFILSFLDPAICGHVFSVANYVNVFHIPQLKAILTSLSLAMLNVFLCLLCAYPVSYCLVFKIKKFQNLLLVFLTLPLWVNFLVQTYAWFFILEHNGLINKLLLHVGLISQPLHLVNNIFAIILVMFHVNLPFMIMPIYNVLEKMDPELIEASKDLGASDWETFKTITLPLSKSGVQLGSFLVFVMSFGEFIIPNLLGGEKIILVGPLISQYFLSPSSMASGAAFTILSSLALIVFLAFLLILSNTLLGKGESK